MALKSSREGLRKELVDYLGNIIIDENLKQNIIKSVDDVFINNEELTTSVNELDEKIRNETSARENADSNLQSNINLETTARQEAISNIEDLIDNGVLKIDLLWTNASPTSSFAKQTIVVNTSNYKLFIIKTLPYTVVENIGVHVCHFGDNLLMHYINTLRRRTIEIYDGSILFYDAITVNNYGSSDAVYNTSVIPYQIYGVR